jgi:cellulose synthase/poly-beta-1,6-N-acetylglucosamine synthase-like glycosyltransferase
MKLFHVGVNSHWPTYQTMKHFYGFSTMLGHGAMIKRECYEKAGGFPPLVAEDLCLSIEARNAGYYVAFAPNIVCREEYPIDYVAFKKRHSKWTQGNLEFIKKYTGKISASKMRWFEKMDIVLFTYNLPLTAVFAFFIFANLMIAPLLGVELGRAYALWMIIPTVIFFFSPMLNDFITWAFRLNPLRTLVYTLSVVVLYGSMLTTSLISATKGIFGKKAKFIVTPKSSQKIDLAFALRFQWKELVFSTVLLGISLLFQRAFLPVALIVLTGYVSLGLLFFSNVRYSERETQKIDRETEEISLKINGLFHYNQSREAGKATKGQKSGVKGKNL